MTKKFCPDPSWRGRRLAVRGTLAGCGLLALLAMAQGTAMAAATFPTLGTVACAALALYIGGASYERTRGIQSQNSIEDSNVEPN